MEGWQWRATVVGEVGVLQSLAEEPGTTRWRVVRDADAFAVTAPSLDAAQSFAEAKDVALGLVQEITGVGRLRYGLRDAFAYGGLHRVDGHGRRAAFAEASAGSLSVRAGFGAAVGDAARHDTPPSSIVVKKLNEDPRLAILIRSHGREPRNWFGLYKTWERIVEAVPRGRQGLIDNGLVSHKDIDDFTKSAHQREISGDDARHASAAKGAPPRKALSIDDGNEFVANLLRRLLERGIPD